MEKEMFRKLFQEYMKKLGFRAKGNICYQYLDDDYLVVVFLDHSPYGREYCVGYGPVYEADSTKNAASTKTDRCEYFYFTSDQAADLAQYPLDDLQSSFGGKLTTWFDYSERSENDFVYSMDENIKKRLIKLYDKEFVLEQYRNDWVLFRKIPYDTVRKICRLAGLDAEQVIRFRDGRYRSLDEYDA